MTTKSTTWYVFLVGCLLLVGSLSIPSGQSFAARTKKKPSAKVCVDSNGNVKLKARCRGNTVPLNLAAIAEQLTGLTTSNVLAGPGLTSKVNGSAVELGVDFGSLVTEGGIVIESTGDSIRLVAGTSEIVLNPQGGVTIQASEIEITADRDVNISGTNVNIHADAQLKMDGAASAEISSGGVAVIKGSLVQIN